MPTDRKSRGQVDAPMQEGDKDWSRECVICGMKPVVFLPDDDSPMCGPCTFGEAETMFGNW